MFAYYLPGTTGWQPKFDGVRTSLWNPAAAALSTGGGQFGFNITGPAITPVVVEACTNLANPVWVPVTTKFLAGGQSQFEDPDWGIYPRRFYRVSPSSATALPGTVFNPDFSSPPLPTGVYYQYNPATAPGQPWTFAGYSGVANDLGDPNSSFAVTNAYPGQYAFVQLAGAATPGAISQTVEFDQVGSYSLFFNAAGRLPCNGNLNYSVQVLPFGGGAGVLSVTHSVSNSAPFASRTYPFTLTSPGKYIIKFTAVSGFGARNDNTVFITNVGVSSP